MKKKVLITGSNGVLGKNLIEYLTKNAGEEYDLIFFDIKNDVVLPPNCTFIKGDIRRKDDIKKVPDDIDIVVHCAAASPAFKDEIVYDIMINGTVNLLESSFKTWNVERFIYISSTSVYGVPDKAPIDENDPVHPYDAYNKGKIRVEKICSEWREKGHCISILRPRSFIGPERLGTFAILYEWASEGRNFPMVGAADHKYQFLDVEDLCQAIFLAMSGEKDKVNDLFNIGSKEFSTIKDDFQSVMDEAGYHKRIISFPAAPMIMALSVLRKLNLSPFYKRLYLKLNSTYFVSIKKAEQQLGYAPKHSDKDALIRNYHWYLANKNKGNYCEGSGNNNLWNQGVLKLAKHLF